MGSFCKCLLHPETADTEQHGDHYIRNTPNWVESIGAFSDALKLSPRTRRVSAGSMTPSSHNLPNSQHTNKSQLLQNISIIHLTWNTRIFLHLADLNQYMIWYDISVYHSWYLGYRIAEYVYEHGDLVRNIYMIRYQCLP